MPDIIHLLEIQATPDQVYAGVTTPSGLSAWWTRGAHGSARTGTSYQLDFGPGFEWQAIVTLAEAPKCFELEMTKADEDWKGTRIGFELQEVESGTRLCFAHRGWRTANDHFLRSNYCWALYLRLLRRHVQHGEFVAYENRFDA